MSKSVKTHHYTYIIRHINGRYYVGRHSTKKDPLLDTYMGSGKWVKSIKDRSTLSKDIIAYYDTSEELKVGEMELIEEYFDDVYCMNMLYSSEGAASGDKNPMYGKRGGLSPNFGINHTEEAKQKMSDAHSGDKNHMYGINHTEEAKQKMSDALSGEKSYKASITDHIARMIKIRISEGLKNKLISVEFNITVAVVQGIRSGRNWKHVKI